MDHLIGPPPMLSIPLLRELIIQLPFIWVVSNDTLGKNQKEINCSA